MAQVKKLYSLTPEHEARFPEWREKWIANAMRTGSYSDEEKAKFTSAINNMYEVAALEVPKRGVFVKSPMLGAIAAGIAAGVWGLRGDAASNKDTFGGIVTQDDIQAGVEAAIETFEDLPLHAHLADAVAQATELMEGDVVDEPKTKRKTVSPKRVEQLKTYFLHCCTYWNSLYNGGNQWSGWVAYLSFFRHIAKLDLDYSKWQHYETAAEAGPRFMHTKFWMLSDLPNVIKIDDENRPHCATGPSHSWPDGTELFHWRGTAIPGEWLIDAGNVDPMLVLTHENVEQRRCLTEIIGWTKVLAKLQPTVIDESPDPEIGTLLRVQPMPGIDEDPFGQFLRVKCGTGREFVLRVSMEAKTAMEAQGELFRLPAGMMATLEKRT